MAKLASIKVDMKRVRALALAMKRFPGATGKMIRKTVMGTALTAQYWAKKNAPVDEGRLMNSIVVDQPTDKFAFVGTNVSYAPFVEYGTGAHKGGTGSSQFVEGVKGWALRHGIAEWMAVVMAIRKRGTKPHPFLEPAFLKAADFAQVALDQNVKNLLKEISKTVRAARLANETAEQKTTRISKKMAAKARRYSRAKAKAFGLSK